MHANSILRQQQLGFRMTVFHQIQEWQGHECQDAVNSIADAVNKAYPAHWPV